MSTPPIERNNAKRVAIVGGGVSGLSAAWHVLNSEDYQVTVFEREATLGGHAWTISVPVGPRSSGVDVDVGFMVFNEENYPNMMNWFDALGVKTENSDMSLSVSIDRDTDMWNPFRIEWSSSGIKGLFATKLQILNPEFYRFFLDMLRFNREAASILLLVDNDPRKHVTTGQYLRDQGYSNAFAKCYLLPMMAALWSASMKDVLDFPAAQLVGFLCNHKMLQLFDRPQWKTVAGRSKTYVDAMANLLGPERIKTSTPIISMKQIKIISSEDEEAPQYELFSTDGVSVGIYDHVIFACHTPTTAKILQDSNLHDNSASELVDLLNRVEYAENVIYVHSDTQLLPRSRNAWASWNCIGKSSLLTTHTRSTSYAADAMEGSSSGFGSHAGENPNYDHDPAKLEGIFGRMKAVYVTYYLNRLQNLKTDVPVLVSLNPHHSPNEKLIYKKLYMDHPQFTSETLEARKKILNSFQGRNGLHFAGAWLGYGFHEDGCRSGMTVAADITKNPVPWVKNASNSSDTAPMSLVSPAPDLAAITVAKNTKSIFRRLRRFFAFTVPVYFCKRIVCSFIRKAIKYGTLELRMMDDDSVLSFGNGQRVSGMADEEPVVLQVFDPWFFVKVAVEYDLGLARSYMSGLFTVQPLANTSLYDPVIRPHSDKSEVTPILGDPIGLTRLFLLFIANRDYKGDSKHVALRSSLGHTYNNALSNASGLLIAKIGSLLNFIRYKLTMDNSERGGSLKNIHAHYDISNDLFKSFLDKKTMMYSSAIFDAIKAPKGQTGLIFRGSLEQAQKRKLDTLLSRGQLKSTHTILDIGFGWGGLSIYAAKKYGCKVYGITLSVEQKSLADKRVRREGLEHLIHFEVVDYRTYARRAENQGRFDRVFSCEMIEAVGHEHLGEFFWAVERLLKSDGVLVMQAITTPDERYQAYLRSTDFINSIIFPGSCCPSLHALVDAAFQHSTLTLDHIDNIGLHYARTLAEWRRRFNGNEALVRNLGFDDVFLRTWNYYLTYCEAGFHSKTMAVLILVFARQGCQALAPLSETRIVTQPAPFTEEETLSWMRERV